MKRFVYLAGPVLGETDKFAKGWREEIAAALAELGIVGVSPLRCEPSHNGVYQPAYDDPLFGTPKAIFAKNMLDTKACDVVLAYMPRPAADKQRSLGTISEIAWAKALGKPVVLVTNDQFLIDHPVVSTSCDWILSDLGQALELLIGLLTVYTGE